ncbi:Ribosomal RNA-processing protein 7 [Tulasnella sp. 418]|nr:Ribosomal RNA-processing protein 7 [Tulasnella sp. 418]
MQVISGFNVLPVKYSPSVEHILYIRSHKSARESPLPDGRTLFVVNVPPDATARELSMLFKPCGAVERVVFGMLGGLDGEEEGDITGEPNPEGLEESSSAEDKDEDMESGEEDGTQPKSKKRRISKEEDTPKVIPLPTPPLRHFRRSGHTAHVVFLDNSSLDRALALPSKSKKLTWPVEDNPPRGLAHYLALHDSLRPPLSAVKEHADSSLEVYDYEKANTKVALAAAASQYKMGEAIVDEDGFTLVTRSGTHGKTLGGGVGVASKKFELSVQQGLYNVTSKKKKNPTEKEGFYRFQVREKKRNVLPDRIYFRKS